MKRFARILAWTFGLLLALAVGGLLWAQHALSTRGRQGLQEGLAKALRVPVNVEAVEFSVFRGHAAVRGLRIGNPAGFTSPHLFASDAFTVSFSPWSLLTGRPRVRTIQLRAPDLTWETRGGFDTNWKAALSALAGGRKEDDHPNRRHPRRDQGGRDGAGLRIETIRIEDAVLRMVAAGQAEPPPPLRLPLIEIHRPGQPDGDSGWSILLKLIAAMGSSWPGQAPAAAPAAP